MKVTRNEKDTVMRPVSEKDHTACDNLMGGSNFAIVSLMQDGRSMYLEFTPVQAEDIEGAV